MEPLTVTGELGPDTSSAIKRFQYSAIGSKKPDGRVDPGGKALSKLAAPVKNSDTIKTLRSVIRASSVTTLAHPGEVSSNLSNIDDVGFLGL